MINKSTAINKKFISRRDLFISSMCSITFINNIYTVNRSYYQLLSSLGHEEQHLPGWLDTTTIPLAATHRDITNRSQKEQRLTGRAIVFSDKPVNAVYVRKLGPTYGWRRNPSRQRHEQAPKACTSHHQTIGAGDCVHAARQIGVRTIIGPSPGFALALGLHRILPYALPIADINTYEVWYGDEHHIDACMEQLKWRDPFAGHFESVSHRDLSRRGIQVVKPADSDLARLMAKFPADRPHDFSVL